MKDAVAYTDHLFRMSSQYIDLSSHAAPHLTNSSRGRSPTISMTCKMRHVTIGCNGHGDDTKRSQTAGFSPCVGTNLFFSPPLCSTIHLSALRKITRDSTAAQFVYLLDLRSFHDNLSRPKTDVARSLVSEETPHMVPGIGESGGGGYAWPPEIGCLASCQGGGKITHRNNRGLLLISLETALG